MDYFVTEKNIRFLLNKTKIDLSIGLNELSELERFLVDFFHGNNSNGRFYSFQEAEDFLYKTKRASILLAPDFNGDSIKNIINTIEQTNEQTITSLSNAYYTFYHSYDQKSTLKTDKGYVRETKQLSIKLRSWLSKIIGEEDNLIAHLSDESLEKLSDVAHLYRILKPYMPKSEYNKAQGIVVRHTDKVVDKILSNKFLENFDARIAQEVLESLTDDNLSFDKFNEKELAKLIKQASSILYKSSKEKIDNVYNIIDRYREHILTLVDDNQKFQDEVNKNVTFKSLVSRSGMLLTNSKDSQEATYMLLTGKPISAVYKELDKKAFPGLSEDDIKKYFGTKINLTPYDLYHILTNNTSLLTLISPNSIVKSTKELDSVLDLVFEKTHKTLRLKRENFVFSKYINRKNLPSLVYKSELTKAEIENFADNIISLNTLIRDTEIFKVMQNNINLFFQDNKTISSDLAKIKAECGTDKEKLSLLLNQYVNQKFTVDKKRSNTNKTPTDYTQDPSDDKVETVIDPDEPFTIDVDGGIYEKPKTFSEILKNLTLEDSLNILGEIASDLESQLQQSEFGFDFNPTYTRLTVQHVQKLIEKSEKLIEQNYSNEQNISIAYTHILDDLKNIRFKKIAEDCKFYLGILNEDFPYQGRGKDKHIKSAQKGSIIERLDADLEANKHVKNPKLKQLLEKHRKEIISQFKDDIKEENLIANAERIKKDNDSLQINNYYAFCSLLSKELEDRVFKELENELE